MSTCRVYFWSDIIYRANHGPKRNKNSIDSLRQVDVLQRQKN